MAAPIRSDLADLTKQPSNFSVNQPKVDLLERFVASQFCIVEAEATHHFGRPPWLDRAMTFIFVEILRAAANALQLGDAADWIRPAARRAASRLARRIARTSVDRALQVRHDSASLAILISSLMAGRDSLYWRELRRAGRHKAMPSFCEIEGGADG